jgi:hypothetical protein
MKSNRWIIAAVLADFLIVVPLATALVNLYVDWLFFVETGYTSVFSKTLATQIASGAVLALVFLVSCWRTWSLPAGPRFPSRVRTRSAAVPPDPSRAVKKVRLAVTGLVLLLATIMIGRWGASLWADILLFLNAMTVGVKDPVFGKDIGFYLFQYSLFDSLKQVVDFCLILAAIVTGIFYFLSGGVLLTQRQIRIDPRVSRHLGFLLGLLIVNMGFGFYLDSLRTLYSEHGVVFGANYTDVHARLLAYRILVVLTPLAGIGVIAGIYRKSMKWATIPLGLVFVVYFLGIAIYPAVLQKFKVTPNELLLETPFIENNIRMTRLGYDLDRIQEIPFDVAYNLTGRDIDRNDATIRNIRLWDHAPLLRTYSQLQQIRTYYRFTDVDNDRYTVDGKYLQVMLSPRELSYADLPSRTWINERLIFTHGNGLTLGPVSRISKEGLPEFFIKDIPPASETDLKVKRPEIYYGEMSNDYVVVKTKIPEFSYPTPEGNIYTSYAGTGGMATGSLSRRLLFSMMFQTEKIFFSSDITGESKILIYRNVRERIRKIAPFLIFDADPYLVISEEGKTGVDGGRLHGIVPDAIFKTRPPQQPPGPERQLYPERRQGHRGRLRRQRPFLHQRSRRQHHPGLHAHLPETVPEPGGDAGGPEATHPLSPVAPAASGLPVLGLPHDRSEGFLQQGGPLGSSDLQRKVHATLLHHHEAARREKRGVHPAPSLHTGQAGQPGGVAGGTVRRSRVRKARGLHLSQGPAHLRAQAGGCADQPGFLHFPAVDSLEPARFEGDPGKPPGHPHRAVPPVRAAAVPCRLGRRGAPGAQAGHRRLRERGGDGREPRPGPAETVRGPEGGRRLVGGGSGPGGGKAGIDPRSRGGCHEVLSRALEMQRQGNWTGYGEEIRKLEQILKKMVN